LPSIKFCLDNGAK